VIIEFNSAAIEKAASAMRALQKSPVDNQSVLNYRAQQYAQLKLRVLARAGGSGYAVLHEYKNLPMSNLRLDSVAILQSLAADPEVKAIYRDEIKRPLLDAGSIAVVDLAPVTAAGITGAGTTVAVIDSGVNYTNAAFGCTSPGVPAACKVNYYHNFADSSTNLDSIGHGTNVSGITVSVAPGTKVAGLNVFGASTTTTDSLVIAGIDWAITNVSAYHIAAINMSLGDSSQNEPSCSGTPYDTPVSNATSAGMQVFAAAGNNAYSGGVSIPACVFSVHPVGAVYSANIGAQNQGVCTDAATAADQVACFTNLPQIPDTGSTYSEYFLAPGVNINGAGITYTGTSQATPFASGAAAIFASLFGSPGSQLTYSPGTTVYYNSLTGDIKTIYRNIQGNNVPFTVATLDIYKSIHAPGDAFAQPLTFQSSQGLCSMASNNIVATKEAAEPNHAGNAGGKSVWITFSEPDTGSFTLDTVGSNFDTLLGVYTGSSVNALTQIAANNTAGNGASKVSFVAGGTYNVAIDGFNGASGNWFLNIHPQNYTLASATSLSGSSGTVYSSVYCASGPVWFTWVAPASGQVSFEPNASFPATMSAQTGSTVVASGNSYGLAFNAVAGTTYNISVARASSSPSSQFILKYYFSSSPQANTYLNLSGGSAATGSNFSYSATIGNRGPAAATNTTFQITLASGVTYVSGSGTLDGNPVACSQSGQVVTCNLGTILSGGSGTLNITADANAPGTYSATATVASAIPNPIPSQDTASANEIVSGVPPSPASSDGPMPPWAYVLMAGGLWWGARRQLKKQS
jgi:uncharacterized repeat protein (TIGR01451 family)